MSQYVYGIVGASARAPGVPGIGGAPPRLVAGDGVAALVGEVAADEARFGREEVLAHTRVLEGARAEGTVLPMRFGVILDDAEQVRARLLVPHAEGLRAALERFAGCAEYRLRVTYIEDVLLREVLAARSDIADLRAQVAGQPDAATYFARIRLGELIASAVEEVRAADAARLLDALAAFAAEVDVTDTADERLVLAASFLIADAQARDFDDVLEGLAAAQVQRMTFKLTGPLAPHSFVELETVA